MHKPDGESTSLKIKTFAEAMAASGNKLDYDVQKWIYVPDYYTEYRYILGTRGRNPLICIGINPSTAEPDHLDNTLKSVERIAVANAFDSFIMFNVYAQRATDPNDMDRQINSLLHKENMKAFAYILEHVDASVRPTVWAAWGTIIEKRPYLRECVKDMVELGRKRDAVWVSAGKRTKTGHPHHPLYLKKDERVVPFDITVYLEKLETHR